MLIFVLAAAMTLAMLTATLYSLHQEAGRVKAEVRAKRNPLH